VYALSASLDDPVVAEPRTFLAELNLGASTAENELGELAHYYLDIDAYRRALRGEIQVVAGRKGSGKTALFAQLRNTLRSDKGNVVLDLKPEGFQLIKFKEHVLNYLEEGAKQHTITAFWEYLLLLETCHKILEKDRERHLRDHRLFEPYRALAAICEEDDFVAEGDFAERMTKLTQRIAQDFQAGPGAGASEPRKMLSAELTEVLYKHDVVELRKLVEQYLAFKNGLWILFDNLDKGWPPHGLQDDDVTTLRCLLDAMSKLERNLGKAHVKCRGTVFIRNDVYELLLDNMSDRGKLSKVALDWTNEDLLRELLRRRFIYGGLSGDPAFASIWRNVCESHIDGEETSQYLIDRCLMRPRCLIDLVQQCRSQAVNLGRDKITVDDIREAESHYSTSLVINIGYELRDVAPEAEDLLYKFTASAVRVSEEDVENAILALRVGEHNRERLKEILLWYGCLGLVRDGGDVAYIYNVNYDMKRFAAILDRIPVERRMYNINPAFWAGLEIAN
jgi:hypothetical protein